MNAAQPGDTIVVSPGVYHEDVSIPAGKDGLKLLSQRGAEATTISGHSLGASAPYSAVVDIASSHVTLGGSHSGFTLTFGGDATLTSQTQLFGVNIGANGNVGNVEGTLVAGNVIRNLASTGSPLPQFGRVVGVAVTESDNTIITSNTLRDIAFVTAASTTDVYDYAVLFYGPNTNAVVTKNTIRGLRETGGACPGTGALAIALNDNLNGGVISKNDVAEVTGNCLAVGISTSAHNGTVTITDNRVSSVTSAANYGAALALKPSGASVNVSGNELRASVSGIAVSLPLGVTSVIQENDIKGNGVGLYNASGALVNATKNWWGCATGPNTAGCDTIVNIPPSTTASSPYLRTPVHRE